MICNNCKSAGNASKRAKTKHNDRESADLKSMAKALHAKCQYPDCYCQHWIK